jgi:hypothetical protein
MKLAIIISLFMMLPMLAHADGGDYRKSDGSYGGSWRGNDVEREYLGPDGSYRGSAERDGSGWTFKDSSGGYAGSSSGPSDRNPFADEED